MRKSSFAELKSKLAMLLMIKKANPGVHINRLDDFVLEMKATMPQEDFAWVEKIVFEENMEAE